MARRLPTFGGEISSGNNCETTVGVEVQKGRNSSRKRLPKWFKTSLPTGQFQITYNETKSNVSKHGLNTVCEEARCPNIHDCWGKGTATFMVGGDVCTRGCKFCAVGTVRSPPTLDSNEAAELADAISKMGISYAVITVVNRDDQDDGGAAHYRGCILEISERNAEIGLELLCSDLEGNLDALSLLLNDLPLRVFAHNVECVPRLDRLVRDRRASFDQSLTILKKAKELRPDLLTKTSLMVGLGESDEEILDAMMRIREAGVDMITIGQYLQPSSKHIPVERFPEPKNFADWDSFGREIGFSAVASGPLVRSSYRAGLLWEEALGGEPVVTRDSTGSAVSHLFDRKIKVIARSQMS